MTPQPAGIGCYNSEAVDIPAGAVYGDLEIDVPPTPGTSTSAQAATNSSLLVSQHQRSAGVNGATVTSWTITISQITTTQIQGSGTVQFGGIDSGQVSGTFTVNNCGTYSGQ